MEEKKFLIEDAIQELIAGLTTAQAKIILSHILLVCMAGVKRESETYTKSHKVGDKLYKTDVMITLLSEILLNPLKKKMIAAGSDFKTTIDLCDMIAEKFFGTGIKENCECVFCLEGRAN